MAGDGAAGEVVVAEPGDAWVVGAGVVRVDVAAEGQVEGGAEVHVRAGAVVFFDDVFVEGFGLGRVGW